jgi:hypothetical protein
LFSVWDNEQQLAQLDDMIRYLSKHRNHERPIDIICMGVTEDAVSKEGIDWVEQRAELGATWWLECLTPDRAGIEDYNDEWPVDALRERVLQGPPQLPEPHKKRADTGSTAGRLRR